GLGEVNLVYLLRSDARAPDWLTTKPGFGTLAHRSESKVRSLVRALESKGYLARETLEHGGSALKITRVGVDALALGGTMLATNAPRQDRQDRQESRRLGAL